MLILPLEVAIPDTALTNCTGLRDRTIKIGMMARAFAIFRVERVYIYTTGRLSNDQKRDVNLILRILRYMDTPQYLRKYVFQRSPSMQFVGLLPPLRTRSHPLAAKVEDLSVGDVRWGIQVRPGKIDLGLDRPVDYPAQVSHRTPTLFRVTAITPSLHLEVIDRSSVDFYFGYECEHLDDLVSLLRSSREKTRIAFSKNGPSFATIADQVSTSIASSQSVIALFGGPHHGVSDILVDSHSLKDEIDYWINTIPNQGTETVRLEEALLISLGLLNNAVGAMIAKPGYF